MNTYIEYKCISMIKYSCIWIFILDISFPLYCTDGYNETNSDSCNGRLVLSAYYIVR